MVSSPLAVPAVTIPIVPEHGGSGVNRLKKFVLDLFRTLSRVFTFVERV